MMTLIMEQEYVSAIENSAVRRLVAYVLGIVLVSAVFLAINTGLVFSLAQGVSSILPEMIGLPQLVQLTMFVGPVFLLYLEWYVWDVLTVRRVRQRT
ncbi:MAG: hypothetical protein ABL921_08400 [Pirellula sp.]